MKLYPFLTAHIKINSKLDTFIWATEKAMAPHSSTLAWKIPWTEEPGGLHSMGSLRVGHNWATSLSLFTFMHWRRKWQPTPVFLPGESQGGGRLVGSIYGVAQSRRRLKRLSSSSSSSIWAKIMKLRRKCRSKFSDPRLGNFCLSYEAKSISNKRKKMNKWNFI